MWRKSENFKDLCDMHSDTQSVRQKNHLSGTRDSVLRALDLDEARHPARPLLRLFWSRTGRHGDSEASVSFAFGFAKNPHLTLWNRQRLSDTRDYGHAVQMPQQGDAVGGS